MYRVTNNSEGGIEWHATNPMTQVVEAYYVPAKKTVVVKDYAVVSATDLQAHVDISEITTVLV